MTTFQTLMVIFVGLAVLGGLTGLIIYLTRRNNQQNTNNNQPGNLCDGGVPVNGTLTLTNTNVEVPLFLTTNNRRRMPIWGTILLIAAGLIIFGLIQWLILSNNGNQSSDTPDNNIQKIITSVAPLNPQTIIDPVNGKIDESTKLLAGKIDSVNQNLTAHRESSKRGYTAQNKKLDEIKAGVEANGGKLDGISKQIADLNASITLLRGELSINVAELKNLLANNASTDDIKSITDKINDLRWEIENLEKQKNDLVGDPD